MTIRRRNKDPRRVQLRRFRCPACGQEQDMPKWKEHVTTAGHIKTTWCYGCQAVRDFVQVSETRAWDEPKDEEGRHDKESETPPNGGSGS